jgi:hypothetical protein
MASVGWLGRGAECLGRFGKRRSQGGRMLMVVLFGGGWGMSRPLW